jgi:hypothetical protein
MGAALTNRPSMATGTDEVTARVTAERLVRYPEQSGFVF